MSDKEIIIHGINIANCHYYVPCEETGLDCILLNNLSAKCSDDKYKYCYYKQRQRLEQENAELRKDIKACNTCERSAKIYGNENAELKAENTELSKIIEWKNGTIVTLAKARDRLKVENEQLKTKNFRFESKQTAMCEQNKELIENNLNLSKEVERLKEDNGKLFDKAIETRKENVALQDTLFTYRQTLQEIKEIAENCMNKDICYACEYVDDCHIEDAEIPTYDICKLLIKLITNVESEK